MARFSLFKKRSHFPVTATGVFSPSYFGAELNPTVATCVNKISNTLASLPINLYSYTKNGKVLAVRHPLFRILEHPAFEETATLFYADLYRQILLSGNGYVFLSKKDGNVVNMQVCESRAVTVERDATTLRKHYKINGVYYTDSQILHIPYPGQGYNGLKGISPTETFKELIALDNALLTYIQTYFNNSIGSRYGIELDASYTNKMKDLDQTYATLLPLINKFVVGNSNAGKIMIPPPGSKLSKLDQPSNAEAELHSLLNMVERQIAEGFNVPFDIINSEANKYNSLEQKQNDFLASCIQPFGNHVCQSFEKLLAPTDTNLFIQFEYKNLLTTDIKTTIDCLKTEFESGMITQNEVRKKLGMADMGPAGDIHFVPVNLMPLTEENIEAYMAKQKLALQQSKEEHTQIGDDKE